MRAAAFTRMSTVSPKLHLCPVEDAGNRVNFKLLIFTHFTKTLIAEQTGS